MSRLYLKLEEGESVPIDGGRITLTLKNQDRKGKKANVMVDTPEDVSIGKPNKSLTPPPQAEGLSNKKAK